MERDQNRDTIGTSRLTWAAVWPPTITPDGVIVMVTNLCDTRFPDAALVELTERRPSTARREQETS